MITRPNPDDAEGIYFVQRTTWVATYPNEQLGISVEQVRSRIEGDDLAVGVARWRAAIDDPSRSILVAKDGDRVVGFVSPFFDEAAQQHRLGGLYVLPDAQGRGVGSELLTAVLQPDMYLHVASYNAPAIAFYRKHGFVETGRELPDPFIPQIEMVRRAS